MATATTSTTLDLVRDAIAASDDGLTVAQLVPLVSASKSAVRTAVRSLIDAGTHVRDDANVVRPVPADDDDDATGGRRRSETLDIDQRGLDAHRAADDGLTIDELAVALKLDVDANGKPVDKTAFMVNYRLSHGTSATFAQIAAQTTDDGTRVKRGGRVVWNAIKPTGTIYDDPTAS